MLQNRVLDLGEEQVLERDILEKVVYNLIKTLPHRKGFAVVFPVAGRRIRLQASDRMERAFG